MARVKVTVPEITQDEFIRLTGEVAEAQLALTASVAKMNTECDAIRANYAAEHARLGAVIDVTSKICERFASANPQVFGDARSIDIARAIVGFRTGQPTVKTAKGVTIDDVVSTLASLDGGDVYIRLGKATLDKEAVLRDREAHPEMFKQAGLRIVQEERFFIDPKEDSPATTRVA